MANSGRELLAFGVRLKLGAPLVLLPPTDAPPVSFAPVRTTTRALTPAGEPFAVTVTVPLAASAPGACSVVSPANPSSKMTRTARLRLDLGMQTISIADTPAKAASIRLPSAVAACTTNLLFPGGMRRCYAPRPGVTAMLPPLVSYCCSRGGYVLVGER